MTSRLDELKRRKEERAMWKARILSTFTVIDYKKSVRWKHNGRAKAWHMRKVEALQALGLNVNSYPTVMLIRELLFELGVIEMRAREANNHLVFAGLKLLNSSASVSDPPE